MGEVVRRATERSDALIDGLLVLARSDRGPGGIDAGRPGQRWPGRRSP